ncbi:Adenylate cyclase 1 [Methyloligella halotolerans]|uniref:Adenylate cyclase 1 n=1 Tax=Methyloligella halotolerans TaxID=1177755 RepID=A0A1E2S1L3_9HYPH|nr:adenylate/guanylate cyclase domain-containing protein [Methyloligella halotolerans]ODA68228.1 Adenylate cyclase 1 [Methyloligella halotolerans]
MRPALSYAVILACVIFGALALRLWDPAPVARLRALAFDSFQRIAPAEFSPDAPVRIVDIDEESLAKLGQWPWPRTLLAELTDKLRENGAAAIGFDMVFPEEDRMSPANLARYWDGADTGPLGEALRNMPANDALFARSIGEAPVILGFIALGNGGGLPERKAGFAHGGDDPRLFAPRFPGAAVSLPELQDAAQGSGALNWIPEYDQVIRRMPMLVTVQDTLLPAFAGEMLRVAQGASTDMVKSSGASGVESFGEQTGISRVRIGDFEVPTDPNGQLWMKFSKSAPERYLPAWKVLNGDIPAAEIAGRIIIIGTSAAGLLDLRATPLEASVPGVELHAQAVEQIIAGDFLLRPDLALPGELLYILLLGIVIATLIYLTGAASSALIAIAAIAGVVGFSWYAYDSLGWLVDPVFPSLALIAIYLTGSLLMFLRTEHERNRVRNAFSHYMAPALVERLAADPARLKLGGEMRNMTLLFSDVRGFTTISEGLDAEELTRFLNELFTPLSNIIVAQDGTIDKYMGDALMAFWNAPLDDPDHAEHACRAALLMMEEMRALNEKWRKEAEKSGRDYRPVTLGIGINTGECCVGNLGSEIRFDYSVIGDNVNIASRIEGQSKTYGVGAVIGESTVERAPGHAFLELDLLKVKGKTQATRIFALLGDRAAGNDDAFITFKERHMAFLEAFRARNWDEADKSAEALAEDQPYGLETLYGLYRERIAIFRETPPPPDWDGSAEAATK